MMCLHSLRLLCSSDTRIFDMWVRNARRSLFCREGIRIVDSQGMHHTAQSISLRHRLPPDKVCYGPWNLTYRSYSTDQLPRDKELEEKAVTSPPTEFLARSGITGKPYPRLKAELLHSHALSQGYTSPYWITIGQMKKMDVSLKEGEIDKVFQLMSGESDENAWSLRLYNADQTTNPHTIRQCAEHAYNSCPSPERNDKRTGFHYRDKTNSYPNSRHYDNPQKQRKHYKTGAQEPGTSLWDL